MKKLLIFTDLDGTLLDHDSYSVAPAAAALAELARRGLTPVFNSSKSRQEILALQQRLVLAAPCICENGAALYNYRHNQQAGVTGQVFGMPLHGWLPQVQQLREQFGFRFEGFADWSVRALCRLTGLSRKQAELAKQREFSEPVLWHDTTAALIRFKACLQALGLQLMEGGRFISIQGQHDKATAMIWLRQQYGDADTLVVALGDSPNDCTMLEAADIAVIVQSAKSDRMQLTSPGLVIHSRQPGPAGWQDAINDILAMLDAGELDSLGH